MGAVRGGKARVFAGRRADLKLPQPREPGLGVWERGEEAEGFHGLRGSWFLKERLEPRIGEVPVVRERPLQTEPAHDGEGQFIHQARRTGEASLVSGPCLVPIGIRRDEEGTASLHRIAESKKIAANIRAGDGVPTFRKNERGRDDTRTALFDQLKRRACRVVPLVADIPSGQQTDRIEEHRGHG